MAPQLGQAATRKYGTASNIAFVIRSVREYDRSLLALALVNAVFTALGRFVPVLMPKYVIDQLTGGGTPAMVLIIVVVFGIAMLLAEGIGRTSGNSVANRFIVVRLRLIARSGQKFMTTDYQNLENPAVLDLSKKGDRACNNNRDGVEGVMHRLLSLCSRALVLAGAGAVITLLHPLMLLIIAVLLAVDFVVSTRTRRLDKQVNDTLAPVQRKLDYMANVMSDFAYGKDIRLCAMSLFLLARYRAEQQQLLAGHTRIQRMWLQAKNTFALTGLAQEGVMYAWLCAQVVNGGMSIGDFTMFAAAIRTFSNALGGMLDDVSHIRQQNEVIDDFRSFLDYPERTKGEERLPAHITANGCCFECVHVSFRYPGREEYALRDVSLIIQPGERLALVGLNGAGKSTLVKLLTRLYEPEEGKILLNGVDVSRYHKPDYWRLFAIVFQDIQLFAFSVAENVSLREYACTDKAKVMACVERAGLGAKILQLPQGIDSTVLKVIDEGGIEFSGGETQKLALARALYKGGQVLVLDEPTAALDALAEEQLYREFDRLIGKRTALYISHRLASTRFCDRIVVLDQGRVVETGTHAELLAAGGRYAELFAAQAKYYQQEVQPA
jgi:ABC-type multidrug transport system fused ATPase/permease subunit